MRSARPACALFGVSFEAPQGASAPVVHWSLTCRVFWCFWGRPDGVGKEPAATEWRRNGAAMASVDRCVFATAVADYQTLTKSGALTFADSQK